MRLRSDLPSLADEIVPLVDRVRYLGYFRLGAGAMVIAFAVLAPATLGVGLGVLAPLTVGYLLSMQLAAALWRRTGRRGLNVFGMMLIGDGIYLAWVVTETGGALSPLRYLVLAHLVAVALLASYRTGLKLALWHSLLLLVAHYAQQAGWAPTMLAEQALPGTGMQRLTGFLVTYWFVTVATSSFSAVNERELRRRRYDLEALAKLATALEHASDPQSVAATLVERVADDFAFERLLVVAEQDGRGEVLAAHGCGDEVTGTPVYGMEGSVIDRVLEQREPALVTHLDPAADPDLVAMLPAGHNHVVLPLGPGVDAVLVAEHGLRSGSRVERRVVSTLERFCGHAGLALRNATLLEDVRRLATVDELTGLANRRTFNDDLERELKRSARTYEPVTLMMLDIDFFKRVNDTYGHQFGDRILAEVARLLVRDLRATDRAARYGGEEFAVILPACDRVEALEIAERLRSNIGTRLADAGITVSIGLASHPDHALDAEGLIHRADQALYVSKGTGRNRVSVADGAIPPLVPASPPASLVEPAGTVAADPDRLAADARDGS